MERNVVVSRRRKTDTTAATAAKIDGFDVLPADSEEAHVLAVDDSLVDRKVIERLLKISSFKGNQKILNFTFLFFVSIFGRVYTDFFNRVKCAVTAVDSGRRALQFLGLDEEKTSSVGFDVRMNYIFKQFSVYFMYI